MIPIVHEVIIIGCGISGIGASHSLSQQNVPHIILQSRDRIGGRILTQNLDSVDLDMGAMVVHHPHENNSIKKIMDSLSWQSQNKRYDLKQIMTLKGELDQNTKERGYVVYRVILENLEKYANKSQHDLSIAEAMSTFIEEKAKVQSEEVMELIKLLLRIHGNIEGAELQQISAKDLYVDDQADVIPKHGYAKVLQNIFNFAKRDVHFNCKVLTINYNSQVIQILTTKNTYYAKKVISSLPLGILKKSTVKFIPQLPQTKIKAIQSIGISVFNKVQVNFTEAFWDTSKKYILLVSTKEHFYRIRSFLDNGQHILCAYVSGESSRYLNTLKDEQIVQEFVACLKRFYPKANIVPKGSLITRWEMDEHTLGSYSFFPANKASVDDVLQLAKPIDGKLWFVGEHCAPEFTASAHGAFQSGIEAGKQVGQILNNNRQDK